MEQLVKNKQLGKREMSTIKLRYMEHQNFIFILAELSCVFNEALFSVIGK